MGAFVLNQLSPACSFAIVRGCLLSRRATNFYDHFRSTPGTRFEPRFRPDPGALLHRVSRQSFTPARGACLREIGEWASWRRERIQVRRRTA